MKQAMGIAALLVVAGAANGQVVISEVLGSTSSTDWEFMELINLGAAPVDISGWSLELWDSDAGAAFGTLDAASPYVVNPGTVLAPGQVWVIGNATAFDGGGPNPDGYDNGSGNESYAGVDFFRNQALPANAIENSSYTVVLADAGLTLQDSWFFPDSDINVSGDLPNRAGVVIAPNYVAPLDGGTFLAAGAYLQSGTLNLLSFSSLNDGTLAGGTPGYNQIPAPGAFALAGLAGLVTSRRRRA